MSRNEVHDLRYDSRTETNAKTRIRPRMEGGFVNTHVATWWPEGWLDTSSLTLLYPAFFPS